MVFVDFIAAVSAHLDARVVRSNPGPRTGFVGESGFLVWEKHDGTLYAPYHAGLDGGIQIGVTSLDALPGCLWSSLRDFQALGFLDGAYLVKHGSFKAWLKPRLADSGSDGATRLADSAPRS